MKSYEVTPVSFGDNPIYQQVRGFVARVHNDLVLVQIVQNYAQWHNLHYAQHVAHQVAQYCESYAQ